VGKSLVLVGVALAAGLLVYWLASGRTSAPIRPPASPIVAPQIGVSPRGSGGEQAPPGRDANTGPIEPPRSEQEKEHDTLESRRAPLYARLRQDLRGSLAAIRPSDEDAATLDLYAIQDAPENTMALLNLAIRDNVAYYGFRHILYYLPNPPMSIERYRLDAEANADRSGNWMTFKK
jgi:hypothetical protein